MSTTGKRQMKIHSQKEKHNCVNKSANQPLIFVYRFSDNKEYGLIIIPFIICVGSVSWAGSHRIVKRNVVAALRELIFEFRVDS